MRFAALALALAAVSTAHAGGTMDGGGSGASTADAPEERSTFAPKNLLGAMTSNAAAMQGVTLNAGYLNSGYLNAGAINASQLNGPGLQGTKLNGPGVQGTQPNGIQPNGIQPNGVKHNGIQIQGVQLQGVDPNLVANISLALPGVEAKNGLLVYAR